MFLNYVSHSHLQISFFNHNYYYHNFHYHFRHAHSFNLCKNYNCQHDFDYLYYLNYYYCCWEINLDLKIVILDNFNFKLKVIKYFFIIIIITIIIKPTFFNFSLYSRFSLSRSQVRVISIYYYSNYCQNFSLYQAVSDCYLNLNLNLINFLLGQNLSWEL